MKLAEQDDDIVAMKFTDTGTDQRNNLESVKSANICIFKEFFTDEGGRTMGECETDLVTADIIINGKVLKRRELSVAYILEQTSAYSSNAT